MLQGVDTSVHQAAVDERKMRAAGIDFRYLKLTEGGDFIDPLTGLKTDPTAAKVNRLAEQVRAIRANDMIVGGYHYMRVRKDRTGAAEIDFALKIQAAVGLGKPSDLRLAIDLEDRVDLNNVGRAFARQYLVSAIQRHRRVTGHFPVFYSFPSYISDLMAGATAGEKSTLASCPLWIAHFDVQAPTIPAPFTQSAIWQKTSKATIGGESPVDFNVADDRRFGAALVKTPAPIVIPVEDPDDSPDDEATRRAQLNCNRFTDRWLKNVTPLIVDGVKGRDAKVTGEFVRRMRHPRDPRFSSARMIAAGIVRRRRQKRRETAIRNEIPSFKGAVLYDGKPVPAWTVKYLDMARNYKGPGGPWRGLVVSGIRTPQRSVELCFEICGAPSCPGRCAGLSSNHNATPPVTDCEGALDVSDFTRFGQIMAAERAPLRNALGARDPVHFSCSGR
jgi:lysozyme